MNINKVISVACILISIIILSGFTNSNINEISTFEVEFENNQNLRAVWITPVTGELSSFTTEVAFKNQMNDMLDVLENYHINTLIFHIRTHNNALYESELNPKASWFENVNFTNFDPLLWLIEKTQSRGIEFHAWLNPYRYSTSYRSEAIPTENPASNPLNILTNPENSALSILNPGIPEVRDFIVDTVLEIINKYPVDAIHFDDYFYTNLGANGSVSGANTILDEPDQQTFETYGGGYNTSSASSKADWRRNQVNLMIESVSTAIRNYNQNHDTYIQFGISPTGIYKNGNGIVTYDQNRKPITNGSQTSGQTHHSSYLFSDSLHWISEGWLDYIAPQSYWAIDHSVAGYHRVMGWWNDVVKYLPVNLYSGIGIYMADESSNTFGWKTNVNELNDQLDYLNLLEHTNGFSIYSYKHLKQHYLNQNIMSVTQIKNASDHFETIEVLPALQSMNPVYLDSVKHIEHNNGELTFNSLDGAKQYYIYRSLDTLTYDNSEIIGVIGKVNSTVISYETNDLTNLYNYGVRGLSYTNHLGAINDDETIVMLDGASIRIGTEEKQQGLRFYANKPHSTESDQHGFYLVYGKTTKLELLDAIQNPINGKAIINDKEVFKVSVLDVEIDGSYSVVLTGIPEIGYTQSISVFAYYEKDGQTYLSTDAITRSVLEVAIRIENAGDSMSETKSIIATVKNSAKMLNISAFNTYTITGIFETDHRNLKNEFIHDWNDLYGTNWIELNSNTFFNNGIIGKETGDHTIFGSRLYKFFNDDALKDKWGWLLDYLLSIDGTTWTSRQIHALKGNGTYEDYPNLYLGRHLLYSIYNFFYEAHEVGGYTAINFSDNKQFYGMVVNYSDQILAKKENYEFFNIDDVIILPTPIPEESIGFIHYLINSQIYYPNDNYTVTGNVIIDFVYS